MDTQYHHLQYLPCEIVLACVLANSLLFTHVAGTVSLLDCLAVNNDAVKGPEN